MQGMSTFSPIWQRNRTPTTSFAMKACPGLRSGIDRISSLSLVIRGIPSPIRPPIRHSGEGRNPEGSGEGIVALGLVPSLGRTARSRKLHGPAYHHFHPLTWPESRGGWTVESRKLQNKTHCAIPAAHPSEKTSFCKTKPTTHPGGPPVRKRLVFAKQKPANPHLERNKWHPTPESRF